jgi:hypothetical protein
LPPKRASAQMWFPRQRRSFRTKFTAVCCSVFRTVNLTRQPLFLKTLKTLRLRRWAQMT